MKDRIEWELLDKFRNSFGNNKNCKLQNSLRLKPILDICLNEKIKKENKFEFNLELEECKIYNQYSSKRCWMFAILNLIKNDMAHNLNQNVVEFELSTNYLNFYDKLEKANHAYETVIEMEIKDDFLLCDYDDHPLLSGYFKNPVRENGKPIFARSLLKKYGIVPMSAMPETYNSMNSDDFNNWFSRKVQYDMLKLLTLKRQNKDVYKAKEKMLEECFNFLSLVLGEPPTKFNYAYVDKNGNKVRLNNQSPMEFYNKYCSLNLDDFVQIAQMPIFEFYKKYEKRYTKNIVEAEGYNFVNIPQREFTNLCLKQLNAGIPVVVSCDNRKYRDKENKVLDTRLFDFEKLFGIKDMNKFEGLETFDCRSRHLMTIRGAHLIDGKPIRWKVEDSGGADARIQGYYVMNNNFFEKCVFYAWINKKFLPKKILNIFETSPTLYGFEGSEI